MKGGRKYTGPKPYRPPERRVTGQRRKGNETKGIWVREEKRFYPLKAGKGSHAGTKAFVPRDVETAELLKERTVVRAEQETPAYLLLGEHNLMPVYRDKRTRKRRVRINRRPRIRQR